MRAAGRARFLIASFLLCATALPPAVSAADYDVALVPGELNAMIHTGTALLAGSSDGAILRSTDLGEGFATVHVAGESEAVLAFDRDGDTLIAAGRGGVVYRSLDGGQNWEETGGQESVILGDWRDIASNGSGRWVAVGSHSGNAAALVSADDGQNWSRVNLGVAGSLEGVAWHSAGERFVAAGDDGVFGGLAFSSPGGSQWSEVPLPDGVASLRFVASDGGSGLIAAGESGSDGSLLRSTATDPEFAFVPESHFTETLLTAVTVGPEAWVVGGESALLIEVAGEAAVEVLAQPVPGGEPLSSLLFIEPTTLLVTGEMPQMSAPVQAPEVSIVLDRSSGNFILTASGTVEDESYRLETSSDLTEWTPLAGSDRIASGPELQWTVTPMPEDRARFWRVVPE